MPKYALPAFAVLTLIPGFPAFAALLSGMAIAILIGNPYVPFTRAWSARLLTWSVIGLGAGMNLSVVASVGAQGFAYTLVGITATLGLGLALGRWLGSDRETSLLIAVGTAICGGSAIAAVAPAIRAKPQSISVALGTVFLLNALALAIFPPIGHLLDLSQRQFGLWSALAIHDTSSVVGSTLQYGTDALQVGTTVKLARALWIVPITFLAGALAQKNGDSSGPQSKPKRPWFILGFLSAAAIVTWIPALQPVGHVVERVARQGLVLTLFLIGANLNLDTLKSVGVKPFVLGFGLWILVGTATVGAILAGWIV